MRADKVEVVDVVAVTVEVGARFDPGADVELEFEAPLPEAVHRPQTHFHDRFGDRAGIPEKSAVHDLELHCCCCWGMARPSSPITFAGTLLGWKEVSRMASSSWRRTLRPSLSNLRGERAT